MKVSFFMLLLLCVCAAILTSLLVYSQHKSSNNQTDELQKLAAEANDLRVQVNELLKAQVRLTEELRAKEKEVVSTAVAATNEPVAAVKSTSPFKQPFLAKAYLDGDYVGLARVSPVFRTDEKTGETIFENIISLSGDARGAIVKTVTNVVEREVVRNTTLNNNYSTRPYWYAYPAWIRPTPTNGTPGRPTPGPPIIRPPSVGIGETVRPESPWKNGGTWKPETIWKNPVVGDP